MAAPRLLWEEIQAQLRPAEWDEVQRVIGVELFEQNAQLRDEALSLSAILTDLAPEVALLRDHDDAVGTDNDGNGLFASPPSSESESKHALSMPELPARAMMREELASFVQQLRERAVERQSEFCVDSLRPRTARERQILLYALGSSEDEASSLSPSPAASRPSTCSSQPSSAAASNVASTLAAAPSPADALRPVLHCVNAFDIDKAAAHIRAYLHEEREHLLAHVEHLQLLIEERHDASSGPKEPESAFPPTVQELVELTARLKVEWETPRRTPSGESESLRRRLPPIVPREKPSFNRESSPQPERETVPPASSPAAAPVAPGSRRIAPQPPSAPRSPMRSARRGSRLVQPGSPSSLHLP
jgi:hypothetical protein